MDSDRLVGAVGRAVVEAKSGGAHFIRVNSGNSKAIGKNQFLFFLKPELTEHTEALDSVTEYVLEKMAEHDMTIESVAAISGEYLAKHGIISEHYGIIDAAARDPSLTITPAMWNALESHFDVTRDAVKVIGGVPYLKQHNELDAESLSSAWLDRGYFRLGSGTYCQYIQGEDVYLVNGFYPRLLDHFTREETCIVTFVLRSSSSWSCARRDFVGATAPAEANKGSVRNGLLERQERFLLAEVSPNLNGVHLSAGPVEGLVELIRFTRNRDSTISGAELSEFVFGRTLAEHFNEAEIANILENSRVETDTGPSTTFDITEELDSDDALAILRSAI